MNELALFAGAGGGILGGKLLGWRTVCAVEYEDYPRRVLLQRQRDGLLPLFPIWDDVQTFDGKPWRGKVNVISGGFPCQDISSAGKGAGIEGERSGLWGEMARIISEVRPRYAWIENSPLLVQRGLQRVLCDLAQMGYDAKWGIVSAENTGAPHRRERIWIMGWNTNEVNECAERELFSGEDAESGSTCGGEVNRAGKVSNANGSGCKKQRGKISNGKEHETIERGDWWETEPDVCRVVNGLASRVDRLKAIGNGQVPQAMALAWEILAGAKNEV